MAELINLNRARKRRDKEEKMNRAETNRVKFGLTKSERERAATEASRSTKNLDQHKLSEGGWT